MKEKTLAIIGVILAMSLIITLGTFVCSWIFKGTF